MEKYYFFNKKSPVIKAFHDLDIYVTVKDPGGETHKKSIYYNKNQKGCEESVK